MFLIFANKNPLPLFQSVPCYTSSSAQVDQAAPPRREPLDKCGSDIGAAGMRSKYAPNIPVSGILHIITPLVKMASAWEEAEIMSSLWSSSALNGSKLKFSVKHLQREGVGAYESVSGRNCLIFP